MQTGNGFYIQIGVILLVAVILFFRVRRMTKMRRLKIEQLWIVPALYAAIATVMFVQRPPVGAVGWGLCAIALVIGAGLGWQRGRMMHIEVDPETHALNQRASPGAFLFIIALIAIRSGARYYLQGSGGWLHLNTLTLTDMLLAMALGLLSMQRLEMVLRARRMLDHARGFASGG